jgi:drug/metabolite transporter (DMT)-like permease
VGGLLLVANTGAVGWAEQRLQSGLTALLCATVPVWLVGIDAGHSGRRLGAGKVAGLATGLLAVVLLVGPSASTIDLPAVLVVLAGTIAWAVGSIYARTAPLVARREQAAGMEMLAAGLMLGVLGVAGGEVGRVHPTQISAPAFGALAYLIVFGSLVAYPAYGWLLRNVSTSVLSTHAYVNPAVAVLLGCLLLGEPLTATTVFAGVLVVISVVLLIGLPRREKRPPLPRPVGLTVLRLGEFSRIAA